MGEIRSFILRLSFSIQYNMSIAVSHLSKRFNLYTRPLHRFKEWLTLNQKRYHTPFWALRDVNLEIPSGTSIGIIGPNGAGKSTLLKIITGTLFPTEGSVTVQGRVAALLELGTGFHPEFTGRLNIYLNGKMLGLSDDEIAARFDDIVRFSELGDFIDQPLRTYSSGMTMRLGFSIASCVDPDVLIVDEALSVGDAYFSQKCVRRIREFREKGVTILFVSHDPTAVLTLCDRAVLLEGGVIQREGEPEEVMDFYNARIAQRSSLGGMQILVRDESDTTGIGTQRSGNFRAIITGIEFRNTQGKSCEVFTSGEHASLVVRVLFLEDVENPTIGILFRNRLGIEVFGANTIGLNKKLGKFRAGEAADIAFSFPVDLGPDDYSLTIAIHMDETHLLTNFDWIDKAWRFRVLPPPDIQFYGLAKLNPQVTVTPASGDGIDISAVVCSTFGQPPSHLDADPVCDRYFLEGWNPPKSGKRLRILDGKGRFAFTPQTSKIDMKLSPENGSVSASFSGCRLFLSWLGGATEASAQSGDVSFVLPDEIIGKSQIFSIMQLTNGSPENSSAKSNRLGVLAINSTE